MQQPGGGNADVGLVVVGRYRRKAPPAWRWRWEAVPFRDRLVEGLTGICQQHPVQGNADGFVRRLRKKGVLYTVDERRKRGARNGKQPFAESRMKRSRRLCHIEFFCHTSLFKFRYIHVTGAFGLHAWERHRSMRSMRRLSDSPAVRKLATW